MSRNSSIYLDMQRLTAQAIAAGHCVVCSGTIANGVCDTCDSRYENGQRVREWAQCPKCEAIYRIRDGHQCAELERE